GPRQNICVKFGMASSVHSHPDLIKQAAKIYARMNAAAHRNLLNPQTAATATAPCPSLPLWHETCAAAPLPMTAAEMAARGWESVDVVFVTGDAYVDHPSFAMAILGRVLEAAGFRVVILSQPDWHSCAPWRQFGRPRLFFAVSAGNMDSLINHYTANRKVRNDDAYSPGGRLGLRPARPTLPYCHRAHEAS